MNKSNISISEAINWLELMREEHGEIAIIMESENRFQKSFNAEVRKVGCENWGKITVHEHVSLDDQFEAFVPTDEYPEETKAILLYKR